MASAMATLAGEMTASDGGILGQQRAIEVEPEGVDGRRGRAGQRRIGRSPRDVRARQLDVRERRGRGYCRLLRGVAEGGADGLGVGPAPICEQPPSVATMSRATATFKFFIAGPSTYALFVLETRDRPPGLPTRAEDAPPPPFVGVARR